MTKRKKPHHIKSFGILDPEISDMRFFKSHCIPDYCFLCSNWRKRRRASYVGVYKTENNKITAYGSCDSHAKSMRIIMSGININNVEVCSIEKFKQDILIENVHSS